MLCVKPEFRRRQKRIFFSVLISMLKIQKISPEKSGLLKTVFSNTVCNCSEKFNMFQLIIFFHKIRIGTCFNYDYLFCRVNIYPLSVHTDSNKLLLVSFRYPPLIAVSYLIINVIICSGFGVFRTYVHAFFNPLPADYLLSVKVSAF